MTTGSLGTTPRYVPGRTVAGTVKMSGNESPSGPVPAAIRAMMNTVGGVNRYPASGSPDLVEALATHHGIPPETVIVGPGSSALLQRLMWVVCAGSGDEILIPRPAFQAYDLFAGQIGVPVRTVPLSPEWSIDLDAFAAAIGPSTRMVVISNPHNPTGTLLDQDSLRRFLTTVPDDVVVVLDEAYIEYAVDGDADAVALAKAHWAYGRDNVVAVRTFSKAYGLAGLRVGYLITPPSLSAAVSGAALPFDVSTVAQAAALASLKSQDSIRARCDLLATDRIRVLTSLWDMGFMPPTSHANHVWLPVGEDATRFEQHCLESGITVLAYPDVGVRITLGSRQDNDLLLNAARAWVSGAGS
ncbi:hypothetical protein BS329_15410 [Amycolatopsis coloradensis]|uniref:Aminotransferase class I/classII large domain-containing protein n=1 Tax=Amycolatopsis coloradensis TaxID=76021 RepID=A0A1R0KU51_9PSEU|nr:aminotransferase class I/II-fold pyridoxal phosphate-dependent enzyme [Amycolatopsis coloradensis]OLZ51652.1 hypothetical protein BS329_15410 [Amycolatopsis coloradensis]